MVMELEELERFAKICSNREGRQYPCGNQIVVCGIATQDRDKALSVMQDKGATLKVKSEERLEWRLNNEKWVWTRWGYHTKGYRFYKMIVDKNIDMTRDEFCFSILAACDLYCCSFEII